MFDFGVQNEAGQTLTGFAKRMHCTQQTLSFNSTRDDSWTLPDGQHQNQMFFAAEDGETLYSQQKQDPELTVAQIMNFSLQNSDLN